MIEYDCPNCSQRLEIPDQFAGQSGRCNKCGAGINVPRILPVKETEVPAPATPQSGPERFGGFWIRVLAYAFDCIVLMAPVHLLMLLLEDPILSVFGPALRDSLGEEQAAVVLPQLANGIGQWLVALIAIPYFIFFEASRLRATPGKLALGLSVSAEDGATIGRWRAAGRFFGKVLSCLLAGIGFVMIAFSKKKQGLHDKLVDTLVVRRQIPAVWRAGSIVAISLGAVVLLFGEIIVYGIPGPIDIVAETPVAEVGGLEFDTRQVFSHLGNPTIQEVLSESSSDGEVLWYEAELEEDSAFYETHDLVAAGWKAEDSTPMKLFFLVEKEGGRILVESFFAGEKEVEGAQALHVFASILLTENLAAKDAKEAVVSEDDPTKETERAVPSEDLAKKEAEARVKRLGGLEIHRKYRLTRRFYTAFDAATYEQIVELETSEGGEDPYPKLSQLVESGRAVRLEEGEQISLKNELPTENWPDFCLISTTVGDVFIKISWLAQSVVTER